MYIPRILIKDHEDYTQAELLATARHIIVLAEPGAGKSELLKKLAATLGAEHFTANVFNQVGPEESNNAVVIDAIDELVKHEQTALKQLLGLLRKSKPKQVILSSRSSEWDQASTRLYQDFLGHEPFVVRLKPFDEQAQRAIFEAYKPGENFNKFAKELGRFNLTSLLPNPKFLQLFSDAYVESDRHFNDKRSIFRLSVEHLAKETNKNAIISDTDLSPEQKVSLSAEIFAKLLLSGAEGVTISQAENDKLYPLLSSLFSDRKIPRSILATRLFKPGKKEGNHQPVHKIVAEYCAAKYFIERIEADVKALSISQCMSIIAPNGVVRDELRGLLGWMATIGNRSLQESIIEVDPYTVLASGVPSELHPKARIKLIRRLRSISQDDPFFRRSDEWRRFSIHGFFTSAVAEEIKEIFDENNDGQLKKLILELIEGSDAIDILREELCALVLNPQEQESVRRLAFFRLSEAKSAFNENFLKTLLLECSYLSLNIAAIFLKRRENSLDEVDMLVKFFHDLANIHSRSIFTFSESESKKAIDSLIDKLTLDVTDTILDRLSSTLTCTCHRDLYACKCSRALSAIIFSLLDRHMALATAPHDPVQVWMWLKNLNVACSNFKQDRISVKVLREDDALRHGIYALAFGSLTNIDELVWTRKKSFLGNWSHPGLHIGVEDHYFLLELAFELGNEALWESLLVAHIRQTFPKDQFRIDLRQLCRKHARENSRLLKIWKAFDRSSTKNQFKIAKSQRYAVRRQLHAQKNLVIRTERSLNAIRINYEKIKQGGDLKVLPLFADLILSTTNKIPEQLGDRAFLSISLQNSIPKIVKKMRYHGDLRLFLTTLKNKGLEKVFFAGCLETFRSKGSLVDLDLEVIQVFRANSFWGQSVMANDERNALYEEVNKIIFSTPQTTESFFRKLIEPELAINTISEQLDILRMETHFKQLNSDIALEWLIKYPSLNFINLKKLFNIACNAKNRNAIEILITQRCRALILQHPLTTDNIEIEKVRMFWIIRAFYFLDESFSDCWEGICAHKKNLLLFCKLNFNISEYETIYWPKLTPQKAKYLLDGFVGYWSDIEHVGYTHDEKTEYENAHQVFDKIIWSFNHAEPNHALPIIESLLKNKLMNRFNSSLKNVKASLIRKLGHLNFLAPSPSAVVEWLDKDSVATVEGLRELIIDQLYAFQQTLFGGEFNTVDRFYMGTQRLNENKSTEIIAEWLNNRLEPKGISIVPEHHMHAQKRCDFTATKMIGGKRRLLVTEVKGQWHNELYTAAESQLSQLYSIHPSAEKQGIYLVLWFGKDELIAGKKNIHITNALQLKQSIETRLPSQLQGLIDIFVLDISRQPANN